MSLHGVCWILGSPGMAVTPAIREVHSGKASPAPRRGSQRIPFSFFLDGLSVNLIHLLNFVYTTSPCLSTTYPWHSPSFSPSCPLKTYPHPLLRQQSAIGRSRLARQRCLAWHDAYDLGRLEVFKHDLRHNCGQEEKARPGPVFSPISFQKRYASILSDKLYTGTRKK